MTPDDFAAARRARLVDDSGKLTYEGRVLVGERPGALESLSEFAQRWEHAGNSAERVLNKLHEQGKFTLTDVKAALEAVYAPKVNSPMSVQEILEELETLRYGYLNGRPDPVAADARLASLVQSLIEQGHYPPQTKLGKHPATMVRGYGPRWNVWQGLIFCPYCAADLRDHGAGPPFLRTAAAVLGERCCPDCLTPLGAPQPAKIPG